MKVAILSFLYEPEVGGGAAVVVNQLAHELVKRSHSVVLITTWPGNSIIIERKDGIKVYRIPPKNLYWVGEKDQQSTIKKVIWQIVDIWNPMAYRIVHQILLNEKPDIVHSHKLRGLSPSIWSAAVSAGVQKIVHTCHDFELLSPEGLFMGNVGKLAENRNFIMRPYQNIRRYFSRHVDVVTAPSKFVLDYHIKFGYFPNAKIRIIPNAADFEWVQSPKSKTDLSQSANRDLETRFLYLGRLDKAKGVDILCQAFSHAIDQVPNMFLSIAGWGPQDQILREKYKSYTNIEFLGPIFGKEKDELFKRCDVLVAPSIAPESFGIVILEAYAHGLPVIASQVGAFPEIVHEGVTGFLVNPGSIEALSIILIRVGKNRNLVKALGSNCLSEARKYSPDFFVTNFLDVYMENNHFESSN